MFVTLDVLRLSVWLNADAYCRVKRNEGMQRKQRAGQRARGRGALAAARKVLLELGTRGAHGKHPAHVCDAGSVPVCHVLVERYELREESAHVCDQRDVPARDGAVGVKGCSLATVPHLDRRLQGDRSVKGTRRRP
eukprot:scaffold23131_cov61-Phaeocystis_antarctica.AAC.10